MRIERVEHDDIENVISEKYNGLTKSHLISLKPKILERYSNYIAIESNKRIKPIAFSLDEKNALTSLYASKTKTAKKITEEVLNILNPNHSDNCLYCGIGEIDQIDHYLPQEYFPEYSILHKNLIPICGKCNEIKGHNIPGYNGKNYLHMIYDILPVESIFNCQIHYSNKIPIISFSILESYADSIINTHFNELKLKKRIEKKSVQYCLQITALIEKFGADYAIEELIRDSHKSQAFFGAFYWKTELINEMIKTKYIENIN